MLLGVLRDDTVPAAPPASDLSSSQQTVLQYVLTILSTMDTICNNYSDHEINEEDF